MKIKLSKSQWEMIGKKAGWTKKSQSMDDDGIAGGGANYSDYVGQHIECSVGVWDAMRHGKMPTDYLRSALHDKLPKKHRYGVLCKWDDVKAIGNGDSIKISGRLVKVEADCG